MVPRSSVDREFEYIVGRAVGKSSQSLPKASQSLPTASQSLPSMFLAEVLARFSPLLRSTLAAKSGFRPLKSAVRYAKMKFDLQFIEVFLKVTF